MRWQAFFATAGPERSGVGLNDLLGRQAWRSLDARARSARADPTRSCLWRGEQDSAGAQRSPRVTRPGAARTRGAGRPPQPASAARKHKDPESAAALPREISSAVQPRETTRARPELNSFRLPAEQDKFNCVAAAEAMLVSAITPELSRAAKRRRLGRIVRAQAQRRTALLYAAYCAGNRVDRCRSSGRIWKRVT